MVRNHRKELHWNAKVLEVDIGRFLLWWCTDCIFPIFWVTISSAEIGNLTKVSQAGAGTGKLRGLGNKVSWRTIEK